MAVIINSELLTVNEALRVYTFNHSRYIFADFTILNNKVIINLINDKIKLELRSFIKAINLKTSIKYIILRLLIVGYKTRVLKRMFD